MSHVSSNELDSKTQKQILNSFELIMSGLSKNEANDFLFSLLSETERIMLAKRLAIAILVKENIEKVKIAESLNVTRETVGRVHLSTILKPKGFDLAVKILNKDKLTQKIKEQLVKVAKYSVGSVGGRVKI